MKTAPEGQLMLSIGTLLASERKKRGIPVEKAAKETRMRPQRIRDMEGDDLSRFTNPSYARMFIIAYAKYLGISMNTIRDHLPERGEPGTEGYQYINTSTDELPTLRHHIGSKSTRQNTTLYALAVATLAVILISGGGLTYYLVVNASRLTAIVDKPPPTSEPEPFVMIKQDIVLANLQPNNGKSEAFENEIAIAAPPTPDPSPLESDNGDRAFLLGSSPDQKPATVQ